MVEHKEGTLECLKCCACVFLTPEHILAYSLGSASELNWCVTVQTENNNKSRFTLENLNMEIGRDWTKICSLLAEPLLSRTLCAEVCRTAVVDISSCAAVCTQG